MSDVLRDAARVLTFRARAEEISSYGRSHLAFGLVATWLAGIGRYWDNPRVGWAQHLGLGSVVYVFVLSFALWLALAPLAPAQASYRKLLTYVTLTAPPALLYAIPVERWYDLATARSINVWFLAAVAGWRVLMYLVFLIRAAKVGVLGTLTALLLPITGIVGALTVLNLERAVFDVMAGLRTEGTAADSTYATLLSITLFSLLALPILLLLWIAAIIDARKRVRSAAIEPRDVRPEEAK